MQTTKKTRSKDSTVLHVRPLMVTPEEAAAALARISRRTLESLVAEGRVSPPRKISGGRVGYLWRELEAFAESCPVSDRLPVAAKRAAQDEPTAA